MKKFIYEMFTGNSTSIKRVIAFLGFITIVFLAVVNSVAHKQIEPSKELLDAILYIVIFCVGGNVVEKFINKSN